LFVRFKLYEFNEVTNTDNIVYIVQYIEYNMSFYRYGNGFIWIIIIIE